MPVGVTRDGADNQLARRRQGPGKRPMSRSIVKALGSARLGWLVAALCVPGLLALATPSDASGQPGGSGPVASGSHQAAARFADLEFSVPYYGRVFSTNIQDQPDAPQAAKTFGSLYFGEVGTVVRDGSGLDLSFAVEGQPDPSGYQFCHPPDDCDDVTVQATPDGLLYLHTQRDFRNLHMYLGGFPSRPVELSASDASSGLKVYREVLVDPPPTAGGCEDYGDNTPEAYTCLFLRELLPPAPAQTTAAVTALKAGLPELVQDSSNYRLVFAEEFDGTPPAANAARCRDGLSTLDDAVWNYYDACRIVDSRGEPCGNVYGGALVLGGARPCQGGLTAPFGNFILGTFGKLHLKYGYVELKYTVNAYRWPGQYLNYNIILYPRGDRIRYLRDRYGVEIRDWEDLLTNSETEIDIFEYEASSRGTVAHQYSNWGLAEARLNLVPTRSTKRTFHCASHPRSIIATTSSTCKDSDTFTVTRGIEWTPRGYRTFVKVDGFHNELTLVPKDKIEIETRPLTETNGVITKRKMTPAELASLNTGASKDRYFEYLDPADPDTLLEQVAIAHIPLPIAASVWGYLRPENDYIRTRMKVDYIRVWQPENLYTDMEPVYQ